MRLIDYIVTFLLNLVSGFVVVALFEVIKAKLGRLQGDSSVRDRLQLWILIHSKGILLTGVAMTGLLLLWILVRFPVATPWVLISIVVAVALISAQLGFYFTLKILNAMFHGLLKALKNFSLKRPSLAPTK
ncbi:MAG: hypothetical protein QOH71_1723 [Blastocatellia bacterium]|jgi:hypothetical protein|nr:hypothetical protein [Blastocatellia bacterium]